MENPNPQVFETITPSSRPVSMMTDEDGNCSEKIDAFEIFELIRHLKDPEHSYSLESLHIIELKNITLDDDNNICRILFTPTIPHCTMATLIGLCIRAKLMRSLTRRFKVCVEIFPGTHQTEEAINKQLNDKERVAAALENFNLLSVVNQCIAYADSIE